MMMNDDSVIGDFRGPVRLFPLPNLVLFPQVVQPLHVFEPRYRQMTVDALAGDRLIGVVLLKPGWEDLSHGRPQIHKVGCLGKIVADQELDDGRFNILLRGLRRIELGKEQSSDKQYRIAQATTLNDAPPAELATAKLLRRELEEAVMAKFAGKGAAADQILDLFRGELALGPLCDILGFALPFPPELKQGLLERLDVPERAKFLITLAQGLRTEVTIGAGPNRKFPPDFSVN